MESLGVSIFERLCSITRREEETENGEVTLLSFQLILQWDIAVLIPNFKIPPLPHFRTDSCSSPLGAERTTMERRVGGKSKLCQNNQTDASPSSNTGLAQKLTFLIIFFYKLVSQYMVKPNQYIFSFSVKTLLNLVLPAPLFNSFLVKLFPPPPFPLAPVQCRNLWGNLNIASRQRRFIEK